MNIIRTHFSLPAMAVFAITASGLLPDLEAAETVTTIEVTTHENVENSGVDLNCTAWIPQGEGPYPVLVLVHGGGFSEGTPMKWAAWKAFASQNYVLFTTRYRLTGEGGNLRTFVQDNMASIKYLAAHAKEFKADMNRLAIVGSSAGGGIVVWMALLGMNQEYKPVWSPYADVPVDIKACVSYYGAWQWHGAKEVVYEQLHAHPEKIQTSFFLTHGTADTVVDPKSTLLLYEWLSKEDLPDDYFTREEHLSSSTFIPVEAHVYEGFEHAFAYNLKGPDNQRAFKDLLPFLDRCFSARDD